MESGKFSEFVPRHIGPSDSEIKDMLQDLGISSLEALMNATIPQQIRLKKPLAMLPGLNETEVLAELRAMATKNQVWRSYIGMGYYNCITPPVILRNILENPGWYTQYTPYQAEISQGRLEALLNFQTMVMDLTGFAIANASLLDEATAAAEAMTMCLSVKGSATVSAQNFFVSEVCHPHVIDVVKTRAEALEINVIVGNHETFDFKQPVFGALISYPATDGTVYNYKAFVERAHAAGALVVADADLLSLTMLVPPAEWDADIAIGNTQRLGVSLGYGGPHAAYLATKDTYRRQMPGRIIGVSQDCQGKPALRLALQTREQHIRRDKATSNICTAQVLLAIMASMYAVYHGPRGLRQIAERIHLNTCSLAQGLKKLGYNISSKPFWDTLRIETQGQKLSSILAAAKSHQINMRILNDTTVTVSLDETVTDTDLGDLLQVFAQASHHKAALDVSALKKEATSPLMASLKRQSAYLTHPVFNSHHSETECLRYIYRLQSKDLSLTTSMIPLGSCTMKLNATTEMLPVTWPEFAQIHPFAPQEQAQGYRELHDSLSGMLAEITGLPGVSLQPNAGSQGEYAGLLVIRRYHQSRGESHRNVCLIPKSAHGTNPASAVMAGMQVVVVECDNQGNVDVNDLKQKASTNNKNLAALMVTYPSTHGVFEEAITEICSIIHSHGGQVYMDGANLNAQVGLCRPGDFGPDVIHINLHKTFCIPHGGGGPGMGPICVKSHLTPYLPKHSMVETGGAKGVGAVSAAPWGSPSILPISWAYIRMMGAEGLTRATQVAILSANYIAKKLDPHFPVLYKGGHGFVAHECIVDLRGLKTSTGIESQDVAKRLMDYGFHAPTVSFPVVGTLMIEPTESESKRELDRFIEAMIAIRQEIRSIEEGRMSRDNNPLKNAPHTADMIASDKWDRPYSREQAVFPVAATRQYKFWPAVGRINEVLGDRQLVCSCPPTNSYS